MDKEENYKLKIQSNNNKTDDPKFYSQNNQKYKTQDTPNTPFAQKRQNFRTNMVQIEDLNECEEVPEIVSASVLIEKSDVVKQVSSPCVKIQIGDRVYTALIDSGSELCFARSQNLNHIKNEEKLPAKPCTVHLTSIQYRSNFHSTLQSI